MPPSVISPLEIWTRPLRKFGTRLVNSRHKIHNNLKKREERDHLTSVVTVGRKDTLKRSVEESMGNLTRRKAQSPFLY
jgi:hypothetical protein